MKFYLGTHQVNWLERTEVPLFLSHRRLGTRKRLPRSVGTWALDSGGFSELSMFGEWRTSAREYVDATYRYVNDIGNLEWAAPQDWMCEPHMLEQTGLSIGEHQERTIASVLELRALGPELPFIPVIQGWEQPDYERHVGMYLDAGIDLSAEPIVGIGSVCRRQNEHEIEDICRAISGAGISLHGFGVKTLGMRYARHLTSADSMAWSFDARRTYPLPGHTHKACSSCLEWALRWRDRAIRKAATQQLTIWEAS